MYRKILCPVDSSACSERALDYALILAERFDASLDVLHVCNVPHYVRPDMLVSMGSEGARPVSEIAKEQAEHELDELVRKQPARVRPRLHVLIGSPAPTIVAAAKRHGHDLIVMGTHGKNQLGRIILGSVAEKVVRQAPCPVLTVHRD
jgi:nucleotide-binding universal stress UspA family protein